MINSVDIEVGGYGDSNGLHNSCIIKITTLKGTNTSIVGNNSDIGLGWQILTRDGSLECEFEPKEISEKIWSVMASIRDENDNIYGEYNKEINSKIMENKNNKTTIRLTESQLAEVIKRTVMKVMKEEQENVLQIGQEYLGGIIFYLDESGKHGLITTEEDYHDKQNQLDWYDAMKLFPPSSKWRLPTIDELNKIYKEKSLLRQNEIGWGKACSSTEHSNPLGIWCIDFSNGKNIGEYKRYKGFIILPVSSF